MYAFRWNSATGNWSRLGTDDDMRGQMSERFGSGVSISADGTMALVGVPGYKASPGMSSVGTARMYTWNEATGRWGRVGSDSDMKEKVPSTWAGTSVSLSAGGTVAVIGVPYYVDDGVDQTMYGTAVAYQCAAQQCAAGSHGPSGAAPCTQCPANTSSWRTAASDSSTCRACMPDRSSSAAGSTSCECNSGLTEQMGASEQMAGAHAHESAGMAVSLSADGMVALVGSQSFNSVSMYTGIARAYRWDIDQWVRLGADTDMVGAQGYESCGMSVSISDDGTTALVGCTGYSSSAGIARAYKWNTPVAGQWNRLGTDSDMLGSANGEWAGSGVSISGDGTVALVGAWQFSDGGAVPSGGTARAYRWDTPTAGQWNFLGSAADMRGASTNQKAGFAVSLSNDGTVALVGAYGNGGTRAFKWNEPVAGKWNELGSAGQLGANAVRSVSISADGTVALAGDDGYAGNAGTARAYRWDSPVAGQWNQLGSDAEMAGASGDAAGTGVAISADGKTALVGSGLFDSDGQNQRGTARMYAWNATAPAGGGWVEIGSGTDRQGALAFTKNGAVVSLSDDATVALLGAPWQNKGLLAEVGTANAYMCFHPKPVGWTPRCTYGTYKVSSLSP